MEKIISSMDGTHIYYQVIGEGEPLFFIHGNSGSHLSFKRQIDFFKTRYQLILMDTRDHGYSSNRSDTLTFGDIVSDINVILKHENIGQTAIIGFSDGANIALTFAAHYPKVVSKLILVSPNIRFEQLKPMQQFLSNQLHSLSKNVLRLKKKTRVLKLAMKDLPISKEQYQHVTMTTLVIMGDRDIVTPDKMLESVDLLPNATLHVIKHCGHSIPLMKASYLNQLAFDFLTDS